MNVYGYPQPGKRKSEEILVAFCGGAGGYIADPLRGLKDPGAAAFYGIGGIEPVYRLAKERAALHRGDFYYLDNAYFDVARGRYFRASRNAPQRASSRPDFARLAELGLEPAPWRKGGAHIVIAEQSDHFMRNVAGYPDGAAGWFNDVMDELKRRTDRPILRRPWLRDKREASATLPADLVGAWALVTHASAAANEALMAGVPVFVTGECVARSMGLSQLSQIEQPRRPDGRREWAARLAASQWRLDEMHAGKAWRALQEEAV